MELTRLKLTRLIEDHPWYVEYIHQAMSRFLENCPYNDQSASFLQCKLILDAAYKDWNEAHQ